MSTIENITRRYQQYRDEVWLVTTVLIILVSGILIGSMIGRAYGGYSGLRESVRDLIDFVPYLDLVNVVSLIIGLYLGLLTLLFFDFKKRIQSSLLIVGTLVSFVFIWAEGVMFTAMGMIDWTIVIITGTVTIFTIGGKTLRRMSFNPDDIYRNRVLTAEGDKPVEFPKAAGYLWWLLVVFVGISFYEAYTEYPQFFVSNSDIFTLQFDAFVENHRIVGSENLIARDMLASFFFLGSFLLFLRYDASKEIVFIGPPRSGKTHLLIGLFAEAQNSNYNPRNVSPYITEQKDYIIARENWAEETEGEVHEMGFNFTTPGVFSKNIFINGLDYPGEYSYFIPEGLRLASEGMDVPETPIDEDPPVEFGGQPIGQQLSGNPDIKNSKWQHLIDNETSGYEETYKTIINDVRGMRETDSGGPEDRVYVYMINSVLPRIRDADVVGFVFDTQEHLKWEQDENSQFVQLGYYQHIMDVSNARRSIGIATKTDVLKQDFVDQRHVEPDTEYAEFREYVNDRLLGGPYKGELQSLQLKPYPVYIENREDTEEDAPKVPLRTFGMEELLQEMGE